MNHDRKAFHNGIRALAQLQVKLKHRPAHAKVPSLVHSLVKEVGLRDDPRRRYFSLLAASALLGRESMYNSFKSKRRTNEKARS